MTNDIEEYVLGQLLFYPQTRALLPRMKADWFETLLIRKAMRNMITNYHSNEPVDYITTTEGMTPKERIQIIEIGQNVHDVANVSQYIPKLEQKYLHKQFIERLGKLDLTKGLKELMDDTQTIIESTRFTTINDPESIHKISARALDNITDAIARGNASRENQRGGLHWIEFWEVGTRVIWL